jgi:DNA-binding MarR family transcriptional regulator
VPSDQHLIFADHVGRFYVREHGFPPMAGRLLGYLMVCEPPQPTIDELAHALMASRSAITGAIKLLEGYGVVQRNRAAGERVDRVIPTTAGLEPRNFDSRLFEEQAALFREGLAVLSDAAPERRAPLEELAALADFLGERLPQVLAEWRQRREALRAAAKRADPKRLAGPKATEQKLQPGTRLERR